MDQFLYRRLGLLIFTFSIGFLSVSVEAKTLRHKPTGFRAKAPEGFRLKASNGIYTIRKGRDRATVMRISTPMTNKETARSLVRGARLKKAKIKGGGSRSVITGLARGKPVFIEIKGSGPVVKVSKFVTRTRGSQSRSAKMVRALTPRDVRILRRITNSARGGVVSNLQIPIPLRRFSAGGASALVPAIAGWNYSGAGGAIDGSRAGQGFFGLGLFWPGQGSTTDPGQIIFNDWPRISGLPMTVNNVAFIPGTGGLLGGGYLSAMFTVRVTIAGISYDVIMTSGTTTISGLGIDWYQSFVAVRTNQFPGLGPALWQTWGTWDASVAQASRAAQTLQTIRTTPVVAIDRRVFDRISDAWVSYIRK